MPTSDRSSRRLALRFTDHARYALTALAAAAWVCATVLPATAHAVPEAESAAMGALKLAKFHYSKEDFDKAAALFMEAYNIHPKPVFLFNAARSSQRAVRLEEAKRRFTALLALKGLDATMVKRARMHLQEVVAVQRALKAARSTSSAPVGAAPPSKNEVPDAGVERTGDWKTPAGWGTTGAGVLLTGVGGLMLSSWSSDQTALDDKMDDRNDDGKVTGIAREAYVDEQESLNTRLNLSVATMGVGLVAIGAGAWMLLTASEDATAWALPQPGGGVLGWTLRF